MKTSRRETSMITTLLLLLALSLLLAWCLTVGDHVGEV
jgi:hypothetical protein